MANKRKGNEDIMEGISERAGEVREQAEQKMKQARKQLGEAKESLTDYIAEHPIKSVLIAAGIGLVIGKMMSHRRD